MRFSSKIQRCELSPVRKFYPYELAAVEKGLKVRHLNIGQPDIQTPPQLFDAVRNFHEPTLAYAPSPGIPALIDAICSYYARIGVTLDAGQQHQLWIPPGMAHGFLALSDTVHLHYKCTDFYHPRDEGSLRWDDPDIGIAWPCTTPVLSAKDAAAPFWREVRQSLPARAR